MRIRQLRVAAGTVCWGITLLLAGCHSTPRPASADVKPAPETADVTDDARAVAEASLGKQAEVLARGNLAQNGREQVLVVNRLSKGARPVDSNDASSTAIFVSRAAVVERNGDRWSEVLLCDEHLKNPYGYLGGSRAARVSGWRLEYRRDPTQGLEMKFTPAEKFDAANADAGPGSEHGYGTFDVRWNKNTKRYQSFDQSHERYLSEVPSLDTPESVLK